MADELTLKLDQTGVRKAVEDAILRTIDDTARDELLRTALAYITTPYERSYNSYRANEPKTPLAQSFNIAVQSVMNETARQLLAEGTEMRAALDALITAELQKYIVERDASFTLALGSAIAESLRTREGI